jgi:hypothetical protein
LEVFVKGFIANVIWRRVIRGSWERFSGLKGGVGWSSTEMVINFVDNIIFELFKGIYWLVIIFILIGCYKERRVE